MHIFKHPLIGRAVQLYALQAELRIYRPEDLEPDELWALEIYTLALIRKRVEDRKD